ncbi:MAG TPA: hypothetical protein VHW04_04755 [Solirubrobacteraceae bacterium]|nr:hypothetical protein [Solirubrobacteraceae bacterium]
MAGPRVVLMAAAGGRPEPLEQELVGRARRWADELAPGGVFPTPAGVGKAVAGLFAGGEGPVLVVWPELVRWRSDHAAGALDDLADDCEISVGPMFDGGFYLVAFARFVPALLDLPDDAWQARDPIGLVADVARRSGLGIGLLRTERGLRTPADVSALLADPLVDDELRRLLS